MHKRLKKSFLVTSSALLRLQKKLNRPKDQASDYENLPLLEAARRKILATMQEGIKILKISPRCSRASSPMGNLN
jgi:hypothetical protein